MAAEMQKSPVVPAAPKDYSLRLSHDATSHASANGQSVVRFVAYDKQFHRSFPDGFAISIPNMVRFLRRAKKSMCSGIRMHTLFVFTKRINAKEKSLCPVRADDKRSGTDFDFPETSSERMTT